MTTNEQAAWCLAEGHTQIRPRRTRKRPFPFNLLAVLLPLLLATISLLVYSDQQMGIRAKALQPFALIIPASSPTAPALTPTPSPGIEPTPPPVPFLPHTVNAQVADLEAHDRFFYAGNPTLPEVALTFDDGPNPGNTPQILAALKKYQVPATFFDVGRLVRLYPDLVRQEIADGHVVGNHSWTHAWLPLLSADAIRKQLKDTSDVIEQVTGIRPVFFRPPYGAFNADTLTVANSFGLTTVIWNNMAKDWTMPGTEVIAARVLSWIHNGTIILLHDGGGNRLQTAAALPTIIEQLRARHFRFVTMAQIVDDYHGVKTPPLPTPTPPPCRRHCLQSRLLGWQEERGTFSNP